MKKIILILSIILVVVSCKNGDKKAQLDKLKGERDKLTEQINKLQSEIAQEKGDTINLNIPVVGIAEVKTQEFNHFIEVQGKIDGEANVAVAPKMAGIVTKVFVKEGDVVKAGQLLAQIDDAVVRQSMDELQTQLTFANNIYVKQKNLWDKKIGSEVQYLTAKNNKEALENKIRTVKEQMEMSRITAPINGSIEEVLVKVGQLAAPGVVPAFRLVNFSTVKVTADVAEAYSAKVKKGDKVYIRFPDFNDDIESNISFTSKYINPTNRTFTIESRLNPGKFEFRANMIAVVKINDYKNTNAIVLPFSVIQKDAKGEYVFVQDSDGKNMIARKRIVKSGQNYNGQAEIIDGLKAGDKIVMSGYQNLEEGQIIKQ
ncbi:MAG: efflux RND transporter periplasmic adaptor subunit [Bacteroidetes bacterium]|nr:efflux RND transporter periplasmic adaptor subunit [Bacteroidota bacterium]